ncbi:MAG: hypothetical protein GC200_05875 [Tepidisphaera sp.]|nr:hypothetical protein [Tepidisphaera sp.]
MFARLLFASLPAALALLGGCASAPQAGSELSYPDDLRQEKVLDIQVFRRGTTLEFTNTTPQPLGPGILWLNKRFGAQIGEIPVGTRARLGLSATRDSAGDQPEQSGFAGSLPVIDIGNTPLLDLNDYYDERGDKFRAGGFFASEPPQPLVLVQVEQMGADGQQHMLGLIVVNNPD